MADYKEYKFEIKNGTRIQMAIDSSAKPNFNLTSTFVKPIDSATFYVGIPMKDGKALEISDNQRIQIKYMNQDVPMIMSCYRDDVVKEGIRTYWKLRRVSERREILQRADERFKVGLKILYMQDSWTPNFDGVIEKDEGLTLDISAGGIAAYIDSRFDVGSICKVTLPLIGQTDAGAEVADIVSVVCWSKDAPKGSPHRLITGMQFRYGDPSEKQIVRNYISAVRELYKI